MTKTPPATPRFLQPGLPSRAVHWRTAFFFMLAALCTLAIFALHTFSNNRIAIAVLYVIVILISVNFSSRRGVFAIALGCAALTVLSFLISDGPHYAADSVWRSGVALLAILITTFLVLRMQSAAERLQNQAHLLDLSHDAIFVRDMADRIAYWNRGAEELYGWRSAETIGRFSLETLGTEFPMAREDVFAELMRTGRWEGELIQTRKDGTRVIVASRWSLQKDANGAPAAILETDTDMTAAKQAQDHLAQAQAELAHVARVATLGELTTTIAHEVNQPLTGIVTNSEACLRWLDRDELAIDEIRETLKRIVRDGRRAGDVVERLRGLSRKGEPQRLPLQINDLVADTLALLRREMKAQDVTLKVGLARHLPAVKADRVQLQQVLINLLINAMQAMQATPRQGRDLEVRTTVQEHGTEVLVAIIDSGCGIANVEAQLFDPFFTTKSDGIGMGLSICRSIIEAHGGRIWPSRNVNAGSTFQFALPAYQSQYQ